jgi:hypothetical protein
MLELLCYGLTGLAALLVIALCLTYVDEQQETASLLQTTARAETGSSAIYSDSCQSDRGQLEVLRG